MKHWEVEYMLEGVNGYLRMRVQAYHSSDACDIVRSMMPKSTVFQAVLVD
jgi:hypothetical protein